LIWRVGGPVHHVTNRMNLLSRVRRTIERERLVPPGARVLAALSGGADSVALLLLLCELRDGGGVELAGAAHLNHQLRGDADADEAFCAALCARLGIRFVSERADVAALARTQKRSLEDAARAARYEFLERAADALGASRIAVGHTIEDQAETFLLRLIRGAGTRGLAAIRPRAGRVVRPLLEVERAALRGYLAGRGEPFREDASNADVAIARNRVRHELMPLLRSRFSPAVDRALARGAALARDDEEFLAAEAIKLAARIVLIDEGVRIDAAGLSSAPRALSSRVARAALERLAGRTPITFDHVQRLIALADPSASGQAISLPGQYAIRVAEAVLLRPARSRARPAANSFAVSLSIPGEVELPAQRVVVAAQPLPETPPPGERPRIWTARGMEVGIAADAVTLPLAVRSRRPGDRFRPLGAPGRRKLQDFLVDRKVARERRDAVPLVVDGRDRIVWVVGESVAEEFRVTNPSQAVILLQVRHLGGVG